MGNDRPAKNASILVLLVAVMLAPGTVSAGGHTYSRQNGNDPSAGYLARCRQRTCTGRAIVDPAYSACCYTFPIQAVYQCPAVLAGQPGSRVVIPPVGPKSGLLGGQPYLYHP